VSGLPAYTRGVMLLVSGMVRDALEDRGDVWSPGTGPEDGAIRNDKGHIVAVTRLIQARSLDPRRSSYTNEI